MELNYWGIIPFTFFSFQGSGLYVIDAYVDYRKMKCDIYIDYHNMFCFSAYKDYSDSTIISSYKGCTKILHEKTKTLIKIEWKNNYPFRVTVWNILDDEQQCKTYSNCMFYWNVPWPIFEDMGNLLTKDVVAMEQFLMKELENSKENESRKLLSHFIFFFKAYCTKNPQIINAEKMNSFMDMYDLFRKILERLAFYFYFSYSKLKEEIKNKYVDVKDESFLGKLSLNQKKGICQALNLLRKYYVLDQVYKYYSIMQEKRDGSN